MKFLSILMLSTFASGAFAAVGGLQVKTFTDYTNSNRQLTRAKVFNVDRAFANRYSLEFYMFSNGEDEICFSGDPREAAAVINVILNTSTGDAYVYPGRVKISATTIFQEVKYEDEGGAHRFVIRVDRCR